MKLIPFLVCALVALAELPAHASSCHSSGSSGSDSDSSSDSSSSSSDDSSWYSSSDSSDSGDSDATPACIDSTDIVGRAQCRSFGAWSARRTPRMRLDVGISTHHIPMAGMAFDGTAEHEPSIQYTLAMDAMKRHSTAMAVSADARLTVLLGEHVYVGAHGSLGSSHASIEQPAGTGSLSLHGSGGVYGAIGAVAGAAVRVDGWELRGEAEAAVRVVGLHMTSRYGDCVDEQDVLHANLQVRPRLSVETWLSPWISAGAAVSANPHRPDDATFAVFIGGHIRAFDAVR